MLERRVHPEKVLILKMLPGETASQKEVARGRLGEERKMIFAFDKNIGRQIRTVVDRALEYTRSFLSLLSDCSGLEYHRISAQQKALDVRSDTTMTSDEYQWHIKLVQDRYHAFNLTFQQAEQVYKYEVEKNNYSDKHSFSAWEEWDFELATFRQIFNEEQLTKYDAFLKENIRRYEQSLTELDGEKSNEIIYHEELIDFYETRFLPDFFKNPLLLLFSRLDRDVAKVDFLKAEYKYFLNDTKKELLTRHFRHNRTFKPNELKVSLLRHKLLYFFPDSAYFRLQMDDPTKAVANYLTSKFRYLPEEIEELLTRKFNELKEFNETIFKKHYGDTRGWHVVVKQATEEEEEKEHRTMTLLLLDKEKYGC
jgi:hypothetical protein